MFARDLVRFRERWGFPFPATPFPGRWHAQKISLRSAHADLARVDHDRWEDRLAAARPPTFFPPAVGRTSLTGGLAFALRAAPFPPRLFPAAVGRASLTAVPRMDRCGSPFLATLFPGRWRVQKKGLRLAHACFAQLDHCPQPATHLRHLMAWTSTVPRNPRAHFLKTVEWERFRSGAV